MYVCDYYGNCDDYTLILIIAFAVVATIVLANILRLKRQSLTTGRSYPPCWQLNLDFPAAGPDRAGKRFRPAACEFHRFWQDLGKRHWFPRPVLRSEGFLYPARRLRHYADDRIPTFVRFSDFNVKVVRFEEIRSHVEFVPISKPYCRTN